MARHFDNFVAGAIDWLWRKRSTGLTLIRIASPLLIVLLGTSWVMEIIVPTSSGILKFSLNVNGGAPAYLVITFLMIVIILFIVGVTLIVLEEKRLGKKRAIAIELRGLRDTSGDPLRDHIPRNIHGRREQILLNIRRSDGSILDPEAALQQVIHLPTSIAQFEAGTDRSDISYVAGGLAPVPFSFLMGVLLDDESKVTLMDWDRNNNCWRTIEGNDDNDRFNIQGIEQIGDAEEIVLSISVSYPTDKKGISEVFTGLPIVSMMLSKLSTDDHWSESKQKEMAQEFFNILRMLCGTKVKRVNLVLAAPNSIVIRFGRIYDTRNLPSVIVWQYEKSQKPPYPWGVNMPISSDTAVIIRP